VDTMAAIKETFFQECEEQLGELESGLLAMEGGQTDSETVNAVFRAVHSIKGGAGAFKLDDLVRFAHIFETALDLVRGGRLVPSPDVLKVMLRAADVLADLVRSSRDGGDVDAARVAVLSDELAALADSQEAAPQADDHAAGGGGDDFDFKPITLSIPLEGEAEAADAPSENTFAISFKPKPELYAKANDTALLLRELGRLGTLQVTCDTSGVPAFGDLDPEGAYLAWTIELKTASDETAVRDVFEFVDGDCDLDIRLTSRPPIQDASDVAETMAVTEVGAEGSQDAKPIDAAAQANGLQVSEPVQEGPKRPPAAKPDAAKAETGAAGASASQATIRVDLDRVDRLINLVGELVINQAMLSQRVIEAGVARASSVAMGLDELEQLTREIQESVMAIRAQPVKPLFQRMSRIIREVADATGKSVRLKTEGEGTEVDRTVIERLADPLTHMIRNAVDHGLEKPEARAAAGKAAEGVVHLSAVHRSGRIVIEVSDDGAGINRARVRDIAVSKGLIAADAQLSNSEIDNLLFLPGFSTAQTVSSISGRGVGMDVVKRSISALGGRISIASRPGQGSTFSMSLPLTLAVLDGMVVKVADETLVVPLTAIVETLKPKAKDVHQLGATSAVMSIRGSFIPLIDVGRQLGYRSNPADALAGVALLVETEGGARTALLVDAIQDQRQVVIKSLEANYGHVPGIAAATILGDGRIALIADVDSIVARCGHESSYREAALAAAG
jgi:two-component system, chemotaxis family, sensor kinase CheA